MTEPELAVLASAITAGCAAFAAFAKWAVGQWATVRREDIVATRDTAAAQRADTTAAVSAQRADGARMVEALLEQAKSNTAVIGKMGELMTKLDTLVEWRERTPVEGYPVVDEHSSERRRVGTAPRGYRPPKPSDHND
jgi:hypothetical protein